ncbi:MAG: metal-dependent hydrolase [Oxalobacter sp.]|nr:MAG: metal-dependent hydrolase [Oxalobacter sp.]
MILAHLPVGYIAAKLLHKRAGSHGVSWKVFLALALVGSIAPDLDFVYYLIDSSRHHHIFFTHYPAFWGALLIGAASWYGFARDRRWPVLALALTLNAFVHVCLDSVAGSIRWLAPVSFEPYALVTVPRVTGSRRLDYLVHWSSWLELIPIVWALLLWRNAKKELA